MKRLLWLGLAALALAPAAAPAQEKAGPKRLLLITESRGFQHGVVARKLKLADGIDPKDLAQAKIPGLEVQFNKEGKARVQYLGRIDVPAAKEVKDSAGKVVARVEPCEVEVTFTDLGKKSGLFTVVCSQDSRAELTGENLKTFDAVWFYTTGELPISDVQKADFLGFVRSGKGFGGSHSATDTFYKWKEYGELIGAYFAGHPSGLQAIKVKVEDPNHPATRHLPREFDYKDEIYKFKNYSPEKVHVLMRVDMKATKNLWRDDLDNPLAWVQSYGKGRVFYTALGHAEHVWRDPLYHEHVLGGLRYLFGTDVGSDAGVRK